MPASTRTIGIDYSGAEKPTASQKGRRVFFAEGEASPVERQEHSLGRGDVRQATRWRFNHRFHPAAMIPALARAAVATKPTLLVTQDGGLWCVIRRGQAFLSPPRNTALLSKIQRIKPVCLCYGYTTHWRHCGNNERSFDVWHRRVCGRHSEETEV